MNKVKTKIKTKIKAFLAPSIFVSLS